jgi:hypothetical protein
MPSNSNKRIYQPIEAEFFRPPLTEEYLQFVHTNPVKLSHANTVLKS